MAEVDPSMAFKLTPSLLEQLGKALTELEAHKDGAADVVSMTEIREHFHDLEIRMMKQYAELEAREKTFKQEEADGRALLAAKEAAVGAKEQDMFDRIQVLKDAAVAAIAESRATHLPPSCYSDDIMDGKVSRSSGETNASLPKGESKTGGNDGEVTFHQELTKFCEQMDTRGLLSFIMENKKNIVVLCEELSHALKFSTEPGRLILGSLEGFYPTQEGDNKKDDAALQGMRQSCVKIMEAMNAMLARADLHAEHFLSLEIKQQAKVIADEWKPKLAHYVSANGNSLEAEAFLRLLATFRIASEFDDDELCKLVLAVCERKQAPELCHSLGLAHKMPGLIEELIRKGKLISAVHFVHAFELVEKYPTVPLLKTYLRDIRRNSQGKRGNSANTEMIQKEVNAKELAALRAVIQCVQKYDLEADYPLDPLQVRVTQLERSKADRRRFRDSTTKPSHSKVARSNGGAFRSPGSGYMAVNGRQASASAPAPAYGPPSVDRFITSRTVLNDPYNSYHAPPAPTYSQQQVYEQSAYYYPTDDRAAAATAAAVPHVYGGYTSSSVPPPYQPYM